MRLLFKGYFNLIRNIKVIWSNGSIVKYSNYLFAFDKHFTMTINERIKAVHVLQRFVMMSRTLLPSFSELMAKENLTKAEQRKVLRIREVYESFHASPQVSIELVNSNIFQLIYEVYKIGLLNKGQTPQTFYIYNAFLQEADRLITIWNKQRLN